MAKKMMHMNWVSSTWQTQKLSMVPKKKNGGEKSGDESEG
jgi:hypothetical protein